jgi:hypothetical protein
VWCWGGLTPKEKRKRRTRTVCANESQYKKNFIPSFHISAMILHTAVQEIDMFSGKHKFSLFDKKENNSEGHLPN